MILEKLVIPIGFDTGLLLQGINAIEGLITGAIDRTQKWAESMDHLGDVTGMSADKLAAWSFVAKKAGVDTETLTNATVILEKGLLKSDGTLDTTGKALQNFGIDVLDAGGKVRDQSDIMNDIAKKYGEFSTQTQRVDFLTNIFGRSGAKLVDVFDTLNKEGGIDKVTEKVKGLGLVLDPSQYEDFQRNLNEVDLTFTGLANAFTGPLLPSAEKLLGTFTTWLQSPWVAEAIGNIGENFGTFIDIIANFAASGDWARLGVDLATFIQGLTGIDITPLITELGKIATWIIDTGIPKVQEFISNFKTGVADFANSSQTETTRISADWNTMLTSLSGLLNQVFGTNGINLIIDWKQIGITALQLIDITLIGLAGSFQMVRRMIVEAETAFNNLATAAKSAFDWILSALNAGGGAGGGGLGAGHGGKPGRASGGSAGGLTWVGERGPELVNLPSNSYVNNNQASQSMGFDYYKFASILAVELAKARD